MQQANIFVALILISLLSCTNSTKSQMDVWKQEIMETEHQFSEMAQKEGIPVAFLFYAADSAVLLRNNVLIKGKEQLNKHYALNQSNWDNVSIEWEPDFVDVSLSGDMAYTYGKYRYSLTDSTGAVHHEEGIFHTIWKRESDGKWKFVWD